HHLVVGGGVPPADHHRSLRTDEPSIALKPVRASPCRLGSATHGARRRRARRDRQLAELALGFGDRVDGPLKLRLDLLRFFEQPLSRYPRTFLEEERHGAVAEASLHSGTLQSLPP